MVTFSNHKTFYFNENMMQMTDFCAERIKRVNFSELSVKEIEKAVILRSFSPCWSKVKMNALKVIIHIIVVFSERWLLYSYALELYYIPALERCAVFYFFQL